MRLRSWYKMVSLGLVALGIIVGAQACGRDFSPRHESEALEPTDGEPSFGGLGGIIGKEGTETGGTLGRGGSGTGGNGGTGGSGDSLFGFGGGGEMNHETEPEGSGGNAGAVVCVSGETLCDGGFLFECRNDGTGFGEPQPCPVDAPSCKDDICKKDEALSLAAGLDHTCAVLVGQTVKCWGSDDYGQLGNGEADQAGKYSPVDVVGLTGALQVVSGQQHSCALLTDSTVSCWGDNSYGQLGTGQTDQQTQYSPVQVVDLENVVQIASGYNHTCALLDTGGVKCWGSDIAGAVGDGSAGTDIKYAPSNVSELSDIAEIATGGDHSCALSAIEGDVRCWGWNYFGQVGNRDTSQAHVQSPTSVLGLLNVKGIAAGANISCAVLEGGGAQCWGLDIQGQVGDGTAEQVDYVYAPTDVESIAGVESVEAGALHACALVWGGRVWCWGDDRHGQLGRGRDEAADYVYSPLLVPDIAEVQSLIVGGWHTCVVLKNRSVKCWGSNEYGRLGTGDPSHGNEYGPALVVGF